MTKIRKRKIYGYVKTFICIGIPKHWRLSLVQVRNVYWLLEFSLSARGERHTVFTMLTVPSDSTNTLRIPGATNWTRLVQLQISSRLAQLRISTRLVQRQITTNCFFQKSAKFPAHRFRAWHHSYPSPIFHLVFLLWHLWLSHLVNTCTQCVHLHVP